MPNLNTDLRKALEKTVIQARDLAETAVHAAVQLAGVGQPKAPSHLDESGHKLRRRLRAHARELGDALYRDDRQDTVKLVQEGAYQHWHRMLFARFLAENNLLMHSDVGVAVTLAECEELAQEEGCDAWELAGRYASRMLPQIFRPDDPVLQIELAPEHQQALEKLLTGLPTEVFLADDSLGWVYQFWQSTRKDEVNKSEVKIGAEELPAVTQLFTEDYMVDFLLHNSLGAWWVTRHPGQPCPVELTYLRTLEDGTPAAGRFEGWPKHLKDFRLLDPCCGSGHFMVAAFRLLVSLRMADEGLSAAEAVDAVLAENIHGLELDARCVEIAVFALALAAWTIPDDSGRPLGVRPNMPSPAIACCGLKVAAKAEDWTALVPDIHPDASRLKAGLKDLHCAFQQAPLLGSLLDLGRRAGDLYTADYNELQGLLAQALKTESPESSEQALTAKGLMEAARLLGSHYHLVITNVPYLARGRQEEALKEFCATHYPDAKNDLANVFLERCLELSKDGGQGVVQIVMPQNWLFLTSYKKQRVSLLKRVQWNLLARLGENGFDSPQAAGAFIILLTQTNAHPAEGFLLHGMDASTPKSASEKAKLLRSSSGLVSVNQNGQLGNPDSAVVFSEIPKFPSIGNWASVHYGSKPGQTARVTRAFWEIPQINSFWMRMESTPDGGPLLTGKSEICYSTKTIEKYKIEEFGIRGKDAWGKQGIIFSKMRELPSTLYLGSFFDDNTYVLIPHSQDDLSCFFCYMTSKNFSNSVRQINQKLNVTRELIESIPFDYSYWKQVALNQYSTDLPEPYSNDPTQWLFHGHPKPATNPLQVTIARLAGYRWPVETDKPMCLSGVASTWIVRCAELEPLIDEDGIVPIPAMRGEQPAADRLRQVLAKASGPEWSPTKEQKLLQETGFGGKSLEAWLRDGFFEQHCQLFQQRPFIWQIWDGLRDGFSVLVNYHKLNRQGLESLTYSYLGDWIIRQKEAATRQESGAQGKLEKALELQKKLVAILEGEAPYDIFVRWKPLAEQPIGWEPDLNDGVRLNIRPFVTAGVLRKDPKINWNKDRGKDVESAPWFKSFKGERINDHHLSLEEKLRARSKAK